MLPLLVMTVLLPLGADLAVPAEGFTEPCRKVELAPAESGILTALLVHEGDRVTRGQLLATLDTDVLEAGLRIAEANCAARGDLQSAEAELQLRQARHTNLQALLSMDHASQEELQRAEADVALARAALLKAQEQHTLAELERQKVEMLLERRKLYSPLEGAVIKTHREERETVSPATPTVITIAELNPLRVVFTVPTALSERVSAGQTVSLLLTESGTPCSGTVEVVAAVTDAASGTVRVKVLIENPSGQYRCGVRCRWIMDLAAAPSAEPNRELLRKAPR